MTSIAGYRTLRRLGSGSRSEVWLGSPLPDRREREIAGGPLDATADAQEPRSHLVALKVFRDGVSAESIDAELRALSRLDHPHIVPVLDVTTTAAMAPCVVLPRYDPGGLARLLAVRARLELGEVVTLIAPLCDAIGEMHGALVSHGNVGIAAVLLSDEGAPVLSGFGSAQMREGKLPATLSRLGSDAAFVRDRRDLALVALGLLARADRPDTTKGLVEWLGTSAPEGAEFVAGLVERLFDLADPAPLSFDPGHGRESAERSGVRPTSATPPRQRQSAQRARVAAEGGGSSITASPAVKDEAPRDALGLRFLGIPGPIVAAVDEATSAVRRTSLVVWRELRTLRRRYIVLGALALVFGSVALGLLATEPATPENHAETGAAEREPLSTSPTNESVSPASPGASSEEARSPAESAISATSAEILLADDPIAAGIELLRMRKECIDAASVSCLEAIVHPDSPVLLADSESIMAAQRSGAAGGRTPWVANSGLELADQMGAAALLREPIAAAPEGSTAPEQSTAPAQSEPASLLIIKSEAGWKIRDIYEN